MQDVYVPPLAVYTPYTSHLFYGAQRTNCVPLPNT